MASTAVEDRGVTASSLIDLMWGLAKEHPEVSKLNLLQLTSREVVSALLKPVTQDSYCSFVDWLADQLRRKAGLPIDEAHNYVHSRTLLGVPKTFVSHSWSGKFRDLMYLPQSLWGSEGTISNHCYWLDLFAINQWDERREIKIQEIKKIRHIIERCERTVLVLDESALAASRIWCVFELWVTIRANHPLEIVFASPNGAWTVLYALCILAGRLSRLDFREAESTNPADKEDILAEIEASGAGIDEINTRVREALTSAARTEVLRKANVPANVMEQAVDLIRQIGCERVLQDDSDRQRVIELFFDHVHYGVRTTRQGSTRDIPE